ncbi:uncharacterized protein K444DRAFT_624453 [Hyaloscypha bicolor E]|uniref:Uncharacterized protein n=1 Tax=Hyaloscypha bicolor E TaxID=1095630 RepID=A0A2J6TSC9_9HELO|nr:uncharacterized protein K444DRAFT_624453 [Hyaloscypha bicolor E]PMD65912.1 hypothetical protein K444DRAFT_624453 [Hyaloscypha bicolor E]
MARTATKRKSESALPTGKRKQRKTSATQRQDSDLSQGECDSSDQLFVDEDHVAPEYVKKLAPKSRKSEPVKRVTKADEYEEDEGRLESQQFLALVEFESKKKRKAAKSANEYMDKFTNGISNADQALKKRRDSLNAASAKLDNDFLEAFTNSYASSRPTAPQIDTSRGRVSASEVSFAVLYERSKQITANAFALIEQFEKANEKTVKIELADLMTNDWGEEIRTAEEVIEAGHIAGLQKYDALVQGGDPEIDGNMAVYAEAIYKQEIPGVGWGRMARKQEKAFKKIDKNFAKAIMA